MPATRVVILSDTHLSDPGKGAGSPAALRPLWRGATRVIFNGDTAETGDPRKREASDQAVAELQALCEADGVRFTMVAGNHDPYITDTHFVRLRGGEVFVTHGDALHFAIAPWAESAKHLKKHHREVVREHNGEVSGDVDAKLLAAKQASARQWWEEAYKRKRPGPVEGLWGKGVLALRVLWYWRTEPKRAMDFAERYAPACRFFVFGHLHRAGVWTDAGDRDGRERTIINTGAYSTPRWPRAVVISGQTLEVFSVKYDRKRGHGLAETPRASFTLKHPPDAGDAADYPDHGTSEPLAGRTERPGPAFVNPAGDAPDKAG